ncbi:unnamed protein product [Blepharisma stoltei]|uniref:Short-chain dehydrogenase/reductase 3 n=1 Tax=Blepharisma stoltei TaxID=1481888 RepID=A0AAU9JST3_9CILI|nr:unnamed protein product [Blepharisma stoltei]
MEAATNKAKEFFDRAKEVLGTKGLIAAGAVSSLLIYKFGKKVVRGQGKAIKGEIAFITGAASGIGKQLAKNLAALGAKVIIADINLEAANALRDELNGKGYQTIAVHCDVTNRASVSLAAETAKQQFGDPTILINNAGIVSGKSFTETSLEVMERTMKVNVISHFYTLKEFLPAMIAADKGHIVTIASAAGLSGTGGLVDYCASKFAAVGLDEALRSELRFKNSKVKTTCVCPYFINTGMFEGVKLSWRFLFPLLDETWVGKRIVEAIRHNEPVLVMPSAVNMTYVMRAFLPTTWMDHVSHIMGFNQAMSTFKGRGAAL